MRVLKRILYTVREILREIGDERAYQRHLAWHGTTHSREEWVRFSEHRMRSRFTNPKCC